MERCDVVDGAVRLVDVVGDRLDDPLSLAHSNAAVPPAMARDAQPPNMPDQAVALLGLGERPALLVGDEVDLDRPAAEQQGRIEVGVAGADTEVEPGLGRADGLALDHPVTPVDGDKGEERVARAQAVVVEDDDVQAVGDRAGEDDLARGRRPDQGAGRGGVFKAAVARVPVVLGRAERVDERCVDRWAVGDSRSGAGGADR